MEKLWIAALGGNAILQPGQAGTAGEQWHNVRQAAEQLAPLIADGYSLIITHGNGPQVGNILKQQEIASRDIPPMPLDICGAQTQGMLGYMLQHSLEEALRRRRLQRPVISVVTEVVVQQDDPAFQDPSKPVGFFASAETAAAAMQRGETWRDDAGRGWRRVVPSPKPIKILQKEAILALCRQGFIVIAAGGGGIPVVASGRGYEPVEAVIDKDSTAALLAGEVGAEGLLILTDIDQIYLHYKTPQQKPLTRLTVAEAEEYQRAGHFHRGSMEPKVQALVAAAKAGGVGVLGSLTEAAAAMAGQRGTHIML